SPVPDGKVAEEVPSISPPEEDAFFFLHLHKSAGTSLKTLLDAHFGVSAVCPAYYWNELEKIPAEQLARYRFFRGHIFGDLSGYLGRPLREFTFLRSLVERTVSQYHQQRRGYDVGLADRIRAIGSLEGCLRDPEVRHVLTNVQAWELAGRITPGDPEFG